MKVFTKLFVLLFLLTGYAHAQKNVLYFNDGSLGTDQMTVALNNLGYNVTNTTDNTTFQTLISTPGNYDLAIYFSQNYNPDYNSVLALANFVNLPGKKGIYTDWSGATSEANLVGIQWAGSYNRTQVLITNSDFAAGITTNPLTLTNTGWGTFSAGMTVNTGGISLAEFTDNGQTAIAHTMNRKMIVFGFLGDVVPNPEVHHKAILTLFSLESKTACEGSNTFFETDTTGSDSTYWQVNEGSGWSAGTRGGDTLFLNNVTTAMDSNLYRALIYKGATIDTVSGGLLTLLSPGTITSEPFNDTLCAGGNALFGLLATGADSFQWQRNISGTWANLSGENNDTLILTNVPVSMNGYTYRCVLFAVCGNDTSAVDTLTVRANPDITGITSSLNPNVNSIYVPKQCTNLTASVIGGKTPYTYSWTPSGSFNPLNACPTLGAWYKATVTDSFGCQDTMSIKQYVMDATSPYPGRVTMCIQSGRRLTTANVQLSLVPFYLSKNFAMGACGATPSKQGGYVFDEMEDLYKVYPNPFAHELNIEFFNLFEEEVSINLTDMTGRVVKEIFKGQMFEGDYTTFTVDASDLPNGMYLVRYSSNSDMRVNKVQLMR
jgi:hypothetical protein